MGDPAGIGPEVILKAFQKNEDLPFRAVVVGDAAFLREADARFATGISIRSIPTVKEALFQPGTLDVIDLANVPASLPRGQASAAGGQASVEYIRKAVDLVMRREADAITTAPINKESLHLAGHLYPGHTELLAELTGGHDVALMLAGNKLRVVLVTTHVPLNEVKSLITCERVSRIIRITHRWLIQHVTETPRIALAGLNPHCGDGGIFGTEETTAILPALEEVRREGIQAEGPFSADALFPRARFGGYDAVLAMYHDQGMIPIKMESLGSAVNITLGLPLIRTSPDHGTAYDIAWQGIASPDSMKGALYMAARLLKPSLSPHS